MEILFWLGLILLALPVICLLAIWTYNIWCFVVLDGLDRLCDLIEKRVK